MKKFKRYFVLLFIIFVIMGGIIALKPFILKDSHDTTILDKFRRDKKAINRLLKNAEELQRIWNEGEDSREWSFVKKNCLKSLNINLPFDESFLRCNPLLLQCNFLFNKNLDYYLKKQNSTWYRYITKSNNAHIGLKSPGYLFIIEDKETHKELNVLLSDQCHEAFLQKRIYAYGPEIKENQNEGIEDYQFDNFNQNIYIDRHLVLNLDINDWIEFGNPNFTKGLVKLIGNDLFMPATTLNYSQMENYCSFKEKQVLLAHYFDAATFLPESMDEVEPKNNRRSPYYWTKKKSDFKVDSQENCNFFYAKECLNKKPFRLNLTSPTWAGMMDSMGGVLEVMRNPIDPESNLKASSYYFDFKSPWHQLGFRAGWDGEDFGLRNFDFKGILPTTSDQKFKVGFRCMREAR